MHFFKDSIKLASLQPSVMIAKGKIYFATMTTCCKGLIFDEIRLSFGNLYLSINLTKKNIFFSHFQSRFQDFKI